MSAPGNPELMAPPGKSMTRSRNSKSEGRPAASTMPSNAPRQIGNKTAPSTSAAPPTPRAARGL
eukprot:7506154-Pyramimonas_sp.AAC.1